MNGHNHVVQTLINAHADVKIAKVCVGCCCVIMCCLSILYDGNVQSGWTPLWVASWYGHVDVVHALVAGGANIHEKDNSNCSYVDIASSKGHHEVAEYLQSAKAIGLSIQHQIWRQRKLWALLAFTLD